MKPRNRQWIATAGTLLLLWSLVAAAGPFVERAEFSAFARDMVERHGFDRQSLVDLFSRSERRQDIIEAISRPAESKPWYEYRPIFVNSRRVDEGIEFWDRHAGLLDRAADQYGVPPEIITAIIGVETRYGRHTGRYRVMDALVTLAFDYPPRSRFFRSELEQFLLLAREEQTDPLMFKGSYAGAMGQAQFIASSYRNYAVDFDGDGKRDLWNSTADAIGSVANYFREHGWREGESVTTRAQVTGGAYQEVVRHGIKPRMSAKALKARGITFEDDIPGDEPVALIELENASGIEHWAGLTNFYVITRYNHSALYAMAVFQLSQQILARRTELAKSNS